MSGKYQARPLVLPGRMVPGQRTSMGVRSPPSYIDRLRPRSGPQESSSPSRRSAAPWSEQKKTTVLSAMPSSSSRSSRIPTCRSIWPTIAAITRALADQGRPEYSRAAGSSAGNS